MRFHFAFLSSFSAQTVNVRVCVCINAYVCAFIIHKIITLSQAGACCFSRLGKGGWGHCKKQRWHLLLVLIWNVCINHKMSPAINGASF